MGKRMYYVLKILLESSQEVLSAKEILEELQKYDISIDIKTIYSCVRQINDFFYHFFNDDMILTVKRRGYCIQHTFLSDGELQFLLDNISFHHDLNIDEQFQLKNKLLSFSPTLQQMKLVPYPIKSQTHSFSLLLNLSTIMKAIEQQMVLTFQYVNYTVEKNHLIEVPSLKGNKGQLYVISPYQIVTQNNHYYLVGYNDKYPNQLTNYRIDRMRQIQTLKKGYQEIREQFNMIDEIEKMTNMYVSHQRDVLELECDYKLLREIVSRFGQNVYAKKLYQDRYYISIDDVSISEGLIGWIMMMQNQLKVISPKYLRLEIKERIDKMSKQYEDMI